MRNRAIRAEKLGKNPRKSAQNARKTCGTCVNAFPECFLRHSDNEDVFAQILQAVRVRCARNFCKNSSKSARFSSEKSSAFSARIAPHDHQNHFNRRRASAWTFSRPCACFEIAARAWRAENVSKPMQNRAIRAEKLGKNPRKSAQNAR